MAVAGLSFRSPCRVCRASIPPGERCMYHLPEASRTSENLLEWKKMTGEYLYLQCMKRLKGDDRKPKSITIKYGPHANNAQRIVDDFRKCSIGSVLEGVEIKFKRKRGGGLCNTCGYRRNFLDTWEPCPSCGSPADCVDWDPAKQLVIGEIEY